MSNTAGESKGSSGRTLGLWLVGLVIVGGLSYVLRTALTSAASVKEPAVVCLLSGTGEILGIDGQAECYRKRLNVHPLGFGTGGDRMVIVGEDFDSSKWKSTVVLVDLRSGELIARKPTSVKMPPLMTGISRSVLVDSAKSKCYFCGGEEANIRDRRLVEFDLESLKVESTPLEGMHPWNTIAIQNDLGMCTSGCVYRFTRPPLAQRDGYDGGKLTRPWFFYTPRSGLFTVNFDAGTVTHLADVELRPLAKEPEYRLAGKRLQLSMTVVDPDQNRLFSVGWPGETGCPIQALDLTTGKVVWSQTVPGTVGQMLLGSGDKLYLFDGASNTFRRIDLATSKLTDYAKLGDHIPKNTVRLLWAR
jgi:hypothetical protein